MTGIARLKTGVREGVLAPTPDQDGQCGKERLAHRPPHLLVAQLSAIWRVVDDPLQWLLQRKKGNPRKKSSGWRNRSFCRTRLGLLLCVREYCGEVDTDCLAKLKALPDHHVDWERPK
jgi:hypothetical protein